MAHGNVDLYSMRQGQCDPNALTALRRLVRYPLVGVPAFVRASSACRKARSCSRSCCRVAAASRANWRSSGGVTHCRIIRSMAWVVWALKVVASTTAESTGETEQSSDGRHHGAGP